MDACPLTERSSCYNYLYHLHSRHLATQSSEWHDYFKEIVQTFLFRSWRERVRRQNTYKYAFLLHPTGTSMVSDIWGIIQSFWLQYYNGCLWEIIFIYFICINYVYWDISIYLISWCWIVILNFFLLFLNYVIIKKVKISQCQISLLKFKNAYHQILAKYSNFSWTL